jgi:SAM-dependent methyltransferase
MKLQVNNWVFPPNDHLWLEKSELASYVDSPLCDGCGSKMEHISVIKNFSDENGLTTGLCLSCGYVKRTRNLTQGWYNEHFSKRWLKRRTEQVVPDEYVFKKISKYVPPAGRVLDIGCGLGDRLLPFQEAGYDVYGVEPSKHRSELAAELLENITTDVCEEYLDKCTLEFDAIYLFNVFQYVENPFTVLEMAANRLKHSGVLYFRVGQLYEDANFCQFAHLGVTRSFLSLCPMMEHFRKLDLWTVEYSHAPFEMVLQKGGFDRYGEKVSHIKKPTMADMERYANRSLKMLRLKVLGRTNIEYFGRVLSLKRISSVGNTFPVEFLYDTDRLPLLLK